MTDANDDVFVIELTYEADLAAINAAIPDHLAYLDRGYADGVFLMSGRKVPRTGGVILARGISLEEIRARAATDPFVARGLARMSVTRFQPNRSSSSLASTNW